MMSCGAGSPIATELGAGVTSSQIVLSTNPDLKEIRLQLQRIINYLVGRDGDRYGDRFNAAAGGMLYEEPEGDQVGLGRGILPDLDRFRKEGRDDELDEYPLRAESAEAAFRLANAALGLAREGLTEAKSEGDIKRIHKSARIISTLLQGAMDIVLA